MEDKCKKLLINFFKEKDELKINIPEFQVSEFNKAFKDIIETNFNYIRIKGEISEIKTATKGQIYLTLKDESSILSGVIWDQKKIFRYYARVRFRNNSN